MANKEQGKGKDKDKKKKKKEGSSSSEIACLIRSCPQKSTRADPGAGAFVIQTAGLARNIETVVEKLQHAPGIFLRASGLAHRNGWLPG